MKKISQLKSLIFLFIFLAGGSVFAELELRYHQLKMKSISDMNKLVASARAHGDNQLHLKRVFVTVLSRPDDGNLQFLYPEIRAELRRINVYDQFLRDISKEAVQAIQSDKISPEDLATYHYILINLISELKVTFDKHPYSQAIVEYISQADLEVSKKVKSEFFLRGVASLVSPTKIAQKVLANNLSEKDTKLSQK